VLAGRLPVPAGLAQQVQLIAELAKTLARSLHASPTTTTQPTGN